jgi:CDP-diacylglycerol--serine O-phosphatidyltransferase
MPFIVRNLANIVTLLNLFCGFIGVIYALYGHTETAAYCIFIAAFFDLADGYIARLLKTKSEIGKELDSLADVVSFGVLPAIIIHSLLLRCHHDWVYSVNFTGLPLVSLLPFAIVVAVAIRLARYNISAHKLDYFIGLPSPANGLFVASLPLILSNDLYALGYQTIYLKNLILNPWLLLAVPALLSWLMLANIPLLSFRFQNFSLQANLPRYVILLAFVVLFILVLFASVPLIILLYVLISLFYRKRIVHPVSDASVH